MNESSPGIEDVLFKQGILFDLDVGRWQAAKKLNVDDLHLPNLDKGAFHLGHKKLLPKHAVAKIQEIESKARSTLASCSSDFPIAGARFVRYPVLEGLLEKLTSLKIKFHIEVKALLTQYPELKKQQLAHLNSQAEKIAEKQLQQGDAKPSKQLQDEINGWLKNQYIKNENAFLEMDELKARFRFEWRMFQVSAADGLSHVSADQAIEAHKKLQGDLQEWIAETAVIMHKTLGEAAANAKALLEKQGKLNPKNLKPLFEAFEAFKSIDFSDSDIKKTLDDIKEKYAYSTKDKDGIDFETSATMLNNNPHAMTNLKELLESIGKYAVEDIAKEAGQVALAKVTGHVRVMDVD
jgi:hypothetical protein